MTSSKGPIISVPKTHPLATTVQTWSSTVDEPVEGDGFLEILSDEEQARADRFHFERDRIRFVARRVFLRNILATYTGIPAREIRYGSSPKGKPQLDPPCDVFFNTSQSHGLAVIAVANLPLVGVDIEHIRPVPDALDIAHRYFSPNELEIIRSSPKSSRAEKFLTLWTRKESYVKAIGGGLSIPLNGFDVSTRDKAKTGRVCSSLEDLSFVFATFEALPGFVGAVTLSGKQVTVIDMTSAADQS